MPKERSLNPALALARKEKKNAQRKHREEKAQKRSQQYARKNPTKLGSEIAELEKLEKLGRLSAHDKSILKKLEDELKDIKQSRGRIIPFIESEVRKQKERDQEEEAPFIPKDPKRSIYYDPVYNPKGVAPPGMPYRERDYTSQSDSDSSVSKIPLPPGPPPAYDITTGHSIEVEPAKATEKSAVDSDRLPKPDIQVEFVDDQIPSQIPVPLPENTAEPVQGAPVQITYSSAPALRDLRKDAVSMIPAAVLREKLKRSRAPRQPAESEQKDSNDTKPIMRRVNAAPDV